MRKSLFVILLFILIMILPMPGRIERTAASPLRPCDVTDSTTEKPTNSNTATYSTHWFRSTDRKLFASASARWFAGDHKVLWERPADSKLTITGYLRDNASVQLIPHIPDGYASDYQSSALFFPAPGCWQVQGSAGDSTLDFTVEVLPHSYAPPDSSCMDFADAVHNSDVIAVGQVIVSTPAQSDFLWQAIKVEKKFKGSLDPQQPYIEMLFDPLYDAPLKPDTSYLFFLDSKPGTSWHMLCGFTPPAEVTDGKLNGKVWEETFDTIASFEERLKAVDKPN